MRQTGLKGALRRSLVAIPGYFSAVFILNCISIFTAIAIIYLIVIGISIWQTGEMKFRHTAATPTLPASSDGLPTASELAALRAWHQGLDTCDAVARYLDARLVAGDSSRYHPPHP